MISTDYDFNWFGKHLKSGLESDRIGGYVTRWGIASDIAEEAVANPGDIRGNLIGQSRQLYCLSRGYRISGSRKLRTALDANARVLLDRFMDRSDSGCFESVSLDGIIHDERKTSYGNAHVAFGLASAARATGNAEYLAAALASRRFVETVLTDEHGGMYGAVDRDGRPLDEAKTQNPIMHHFEGMLALADCDGQGEVRGSLQAAGSFMLERLRRPNGGVVPENYRDDWTVLPGPEGGAVFGGHMFEWAFFLLEASGRGLPREWVAAAEELVARGLEIAFDDADGGIHSVLYPEGGVSSGYKTFWEQCEAVRVMLRLALLYGREELWPYIHRITEYIRRTFVRDDGVWYFMVRDDGTRVPVEGSHMLDYHTIGLFAEAERLSTHTKSL